MTIDLSSEGVITGVVSVLSLIFGLYGRSLQAKNDALQRQIDDFGEQHEKDVERLDDMNTKIWSEIRCQMEASTRNSEAIIKLLGSIDRLNEILTKMDNKLDSKMSSEMCSTIRQNYVNLRRENRPMPGGRRHDDPNE